MSRVLITGGTGYVGGRLAQVVAEAGDDVVIASRRDSQLPWLPQAQLRIIDWESRDSLTEACREIDTVFHFAALNDEESRRDPVAALRVNGVYTSRLLEVAIGEGVRRFLYLSTSQVYGIAAGRIDEATMPRPKNSYATSHRAAEDCVLCAHDCGVVIGIVARLSNGFGYPAHPAVNCWRLLVNDLCRQAVTSGQLVLKTAGLQSRNFIPMSEAVRALTHLSTLPKEQVGDGLFNVGARTMRVLDMAELIGERCQSVLGFSPPIVRPAVDTADHAAFEYSTEKLARTGFITDRSQETAEIDATLRLCQTLLPS